MLLRITRKPLLTPPIPERDLDPTALPPSAHISSPTLAASSSSSPTITPQHLRNNRVALPPHPLLTSPPPASSDTSVEDYLLPKALTTSSMKPSLTLVRTLSSPQDWVAESLYILRPLVYGTSFIPLLSIELTAPLNSFTVGIESKLKLPFASSIGYGITFEVVAPLPPSVCRSRACRIC